jgi:hypothetical protein
MLNATLGTAGAIAIGVVVLEGGAAVIAALPASFIGGLTEGWQAGGTVIAYGQLTAADTHEEAGAAIVAAASGTAGMIAAGEAAAAKVAAAGDDLVFYHGAPTSSAHSIVTEGIKPVSTATKGLPPGTFFTHAADQPNALIMASTWPIVQGKASSTGVTVVKIVIPRATVRSLGRRVVVRAIGPSPSMPMETAFLPDTLELINRSAQFSLIEPIF